MRLENNDEQTISKEELVKMFRDYQSGVDKSTFPEVVLRRLDKFIWSRVWDFQTYAQNGYAEEMYQVAALAILERLPSWNPKFALTTYFGPVIKGALYAYIADYIHGLNKNDLNKNKKINDAALALMNQDIEPTIENIVRYINDGVNYTREVVVKNLNVVARTKSIIHLDDTPNEDCGGSLLDTLVHDSRSPETIYEKQELADTITRALSKLTEEERNVIVSLIMEENSLKATSEMLNISELKIKRIRTSALDKLKRSPILRTYLGLAEEGVSDSFEIEFTGFDNFEEVEDNSDVEILAFV